MSDIIREYAKALFELATETGNQEKYGRALDDVLSVFSDNPEYTEFLSSPGISLNERLNALDAAFAESLPKDVLSFLKLLSEKRYIKEFGKCTEEYNALLAETTKIATAKVTSAVALSEKEQTDLKNQLEKLTGHTVIIECMVDKSILGGLIVEIDGKVADASLERHLKEVKDVMFK